MLRGMCNERIGNKYLGGRLKVVAVIESYIEVSNVMLKTVL